MLRYAVPLLLSSSALAQETIVVTGRALPQASGAAAYGSVTLDREALTDDPSGRLENALRDVAGFQQFRRTDSRAANPTSQGATLRALGGNAASRALVLLDGVPVADPFGGWIPWPALTPERLSAARITRGGGAGAFGAGALAGTIELFSAGIDDLPRFGGSLAYGSRDSLALGADTATRLGEGFATLSGRLDRGDGYILLPERQRGPIDVPARYEQWSLAARGVAPIGDQTELQARALVFADDRRRGLVGAESGSEGADASLRLVGRGNWAWEALAYIQARRFESGFRSANAARTAATPTLDQFNTPATGVGAKLEIRPPVSANHEIQLGADLRSASGRTKERFRFQNANFTRLREAGGETRIAGLYAEDSWRLSEQLTLTGGVRLDRWWIADGFLRERDAADGGLLLDVDRADRNGWEPTTRAGVLFAATPALDLRAAAYRGFRLPTLNELHRPFRLGPDATVANAALDPERLTGAEVGIDFNPLSNARAGVTLFWNRLGDAIANVTLARGPGNFPEAGFVAAGGAYRRRENLDAIVARGVEAYGSLDYGPWRLALSYAYTDVEVRADGLAAELDGRRPAQTPRHLASATVGYGAGDVRAALTARYLGSQFEDDLESRRLGEAFTLDATAEAPLARGMALTLSAENILDEEIQAGISESGIVDRGTPRTLWMGIRFSLR